MVAALSLAVSVALAGCGGGEPASHVDASANPLLLPQEFAQGKITITQNPMDLAIRGGGFFQLSQDHSPLMYSRAGRFNLDADGYVVNEAQMRVMGHLADAAGVIDTRRRSVPLRLSSALLPPQATDSITLVMNLDWRAPATGRAAAPGIDFDDADTYNHAVGLTVYDVRGQPVALTLYFQKSELAGAAPGSVLWNVYATANGLPVGGTSSAPLATLVFPADGRAPTAPSGKVTLPQIVAGASDGGAVIVPLSDVVLNLEGATQFALHFGVFDLQQTGSPPGSLIGVEFKTDGTLMGRYSNGRTIPIGQLELASFGDLRCLQSASEKAWIATPACGESRVAAPGSGSFGVLQVGALEEN